MRIRPEVALNYLQTTWWRWRNNPATVFGSLTSLVIGTVCIALLTSYLKNELSTDRFHPYADQIYLTVVRQKPYTNKRSLHIKRFFDFDPARYPGVAKATTVLKYGKDRMVLKGENQSFTGVALVVDSNFLDVFDFPVILGDPVALRDPGSILLTRAFALKHFGSLDVLNKPLEWIADRRRTYKIAGIVEDIPSKSSLQFDFLVPHHSMQFTGSGGCFLLVNEQFDKQKFETEITKVGRGQEYYEESETSLVSLRELYFNKEDLELEFITSKSGNVKTLYIISIIALVVLIISILNLTNLWALQAISDRKEVLIRKVNGAKRMDLVRYQFEKSSPAFVFAIILSILLYTYTLPAFNRLLGTALSVNWMEMLIMITGVVLVIGTISQIYPLLLITKPVLEDSISQQLAGSKNSYSRKLIISLQYTFTVILLISAMVVSRQLRMMLDKDLGIDYTNVLRTKLIFDKSHEFLNADREGRRKVWENQKREHEFVEAEMKSSPFLVDFTQGVSPFEPWPYYSFKPKGSPEEYESVKLLIVTPGYEKIFDLQLEAGRFFEENGTVGPRHNRVLINEAARAHWGIRDISDTQLFQEGSPHEYLEIIGVIKDYNYDHLSVATQPLILYMQQTFDNDFFIKLREGQRAEGLRFLKSLFEKINPAQQFDYSFVEEEVRAMYRNERKLANIYIVLTLIAFFLSSIGLFTVALYDVQKRTKEIGIRKVNGAKTAQIIAMLNRDFIRWVLLGFILACPIAYYTASKWLENFAYKTTLSWWIFAAAGLLALVVALLTVSWQSWRAAVQNPVEVLKYE